MEGIRIFCENTSSYEKVSIGTTLCDLYGHMSHDNPIFDEPVLAALVDNKLKSLDYKVINPHNIRFIGYDHPDGRRTYIRSLCFVLQKVVREMFPDKVLVIDYSLPSGLYCEIQEPHAMEDGRPCRYFLTDETIEAIEARMGQIIEADLPFGKTMMSLEECCRIFERQHQTEKVNLLKTTGRFNYNVYTLDGTVDTFYGPLVPSTGLLTTFNLAGFNDGFCLQYPMEGETGKVLPMKRQSKLATALKEHSDWCSIMGVRGVGKLNDKVLSGGIVDLINLSEALHERKYADIADQIYARRGSVKIVFIAGPSSSGKTSTSKRLALQCRILGLNPRVIELDNYFVDRELTPRDENGEYDFENEQSFAPALCHRIDRNTQGIVIGAKNAQALRDLNEAIRLRNIDKYYLCIVEGILTKKKGKVKAYHKKENQQVFIRDSYEAGYTEKILEILEKTNVKATFFITAHYINTAEELVKKMVQNGHDVR